MTINALTLPTDIPWKRLCVSDDMIDAEVCDRRFPARWRSSVAVFSYQPPDDDQVYDGMLVSYLKVACTITGYQAKGPEVGISDRRIHAAFSSEVVKDYLNAVDRYYGAYGAILEVSIAPQRDSRGSVPLSQYPYFADFEPKKREIYELVSETGEVMSRSLDTVNVRKGTTTSESKEVVDSLKVDLGLGSAPAAASGGLLPKLGVESSSSSRVMNSEEVANSRTTDLAREARETLSHTTQITQMYHQFTSYHLGTNRAVFFMLPRPHIAQSLPTFVNGPRQLEGIQEVFLVVMRPKSVPDVCVEAYLETAHLALEPVAEYAQQTQSFSFTISSNTAKLVQKNLGNGRWVTYLDHTGRFPVPTGWEVDTSRGAGGFDVQPPIGGIVLNAYANVSEQGGWVEAYGQIGINTDGVKWDDLLDIVWNDAKAVEAFLRLKAAPDEVKRMALDIGVTVFLRSKEATVVNDRPSTLFLTGRGVCCCDTQSVRGLSDFLIWEGSLHHGLGISSDGTMSARDANRLRTHVGDRMLHSLNDDARYPRGFVGLAEAQFVAARLARATRVSRIPDSVRVGDLLGLDKNISDRMASVASTISRSRLLEMPLREQVDRFGITQEQAVMLRRALLGLTAPVPEPEFRWDPPVAEGGKSRSVIPNLVGLSLDEARESLAQIRVVVAGTEYKDSTLPQGTVLQQSLAAGAEVPFDRSIDLTLASGASVRIPDIVGLPLTDALMRLRESGLRSEPTIAFVGSKEHPRNYVVGVSPTMRSYVTPHDLVSLDISDGSGGQVRQGGKR